METGFRGTFVISWTQTELDGQWNAPLGLLGIGTAWSWTGEAVRVDGAAQVLALGDAVGTADIRRRAAHSVRRLVGAVAADTTALDQVEVDAPLFETGFTLTDGRRTWTATLIATAPGKPPLIMFMGDVPPNHAEFWVVSHNIKPDVIDPRGETPGGVICFTPGTMILTEDGPLPVEQVTEGVRVQTKDNGCQEVLWTGERRISGARLYAMPHLAPIRLREGALDRGVPDTGILVSPDHRMMLRGARAQALFNTDEVLVAARDLVNDSTVLVDRSVREVTYIHMLLPHHQVVFANGVETESFHPASAALGSMGDDQVTELLDRLPEVIDDPQSYGAYARRVLSTSEAAILRSDWR